MAENLVIVESPAKAKTIKKYLGKSFEVLASYGHVRDLVPKEGAVDPEHDFAMKYRIIERNEKHVDAIAKQLRKADALYLATDPDREGEAISWHLYELLKEKGELKGKQVHRVVFYEITRNAIQAAIKEPRDLAMDLVNAQQARRALDYLVGFNLSPLLWKKVRQGLSAGRVQSPALRMICERDEAIDAFKPQEYWTIEAEGEHSEVTFPLKLVEYAGKKVEQFSFTNETQAREVEATLNKAAAGKLTVDTIDRKQRRRNPAPPFTTSTLQQEAARKLGFSAQRTMRLAQQLYEGVDFGEGAVGLITYMRTDSVNLAAEAVTEIRVVIERLYGKEGLAEEPRAYKTKSKNAQEAHEAVRPTSASITPQQLEGKIEADQLKLYTLIWKRAVACQMAHALFDTVAVDLIAGNRGSGNMLRANGSTLVKPGYIAVYQEGQDDKADDDDDHVLPAMHEGDLVKLEGLHGEQHFTEPPPRFSEGVAGEGAGRARHRPPVHLCLDHLHAARPRVRGHGRAALHRHRHRQDRQSLPDQVLHQVRGIRLHRRHGRRARRRVARRGAVDRAAGKILETLHRPGPGRGGQRQPRSRGHGARTGHGPGFGPSGLRAHGSLRTIRAGRHQGRRREAQVRRAASRPEDGRHHPGRGAGAVPAAAQTR